MSIEHLFKGFASAVLDEGVKHDKSQYGIGGGDFRALVAEAFPDPEWVSPTLAMVRMGGGGRSWAVGVHAVGGAAMATVESGVSIPRRDLAEHGAMLAYLLKQNAARAHVRWALSARGASESPTVIATLPFEGLAHRALWDLAAAVTAEVVEFHNALDS